MKITNINDVKEGHVITFRSNYNGGLSRKFYKINYIKDEKYYCMTFPKEETKDRWYDTIIDRLFDIKEDEVFETYQEAIENYNEGIFMIYLIEDYTDKGEKVKAMKIGGADLGSGLRTAINYVAQDYSEIYPENKVKRFTKIGDDWEDAMNKHPDLFI